MEVKEVQRQPRTPGRKLPARGIARYPWATAIAIIIIAGGIAALYFYHIGPFALPKTSPKSNAQSVQKTATVTAQKTATAVALNVQPTATALVSALPAAQQKALAASPCNSAQILSQITDTTPAPSAADSAKINRTFKSAPAMSIDTKKLYCAGVNTNRGLIVIELRPDWAPKTVNNFVFLAQNKFFDGLVFHRVIQTGNGIHIIQTGDPHGSDAAQRGRGGPGYQFADEPVKGNYTFGTVAMANSGADTNGSQFFINTGDNSKGLQKKYNLFGQVVKGLDTTLEIQGPGDDPATQNITPDVINHLVVVPAS
jgi:cyclophilin family peptidyl-prolyl cis-trans isomerase